MGLPHWTVPTTPPKPSAPDHEADPTRQRGIRRRRVIRRNSSSGSNGGIIIPTTSSASLLAQTAAMERQIRETQAAIERLDPDAGVAAARLVDARFSGRDNEEETGHAAALERIGREAARRQLQIRRAMEVGRRAYRESVGIENPSPTWDGGSLTADTVDPFTWPRRQDGSVIPPPMEPSHSQPREPPASTAQSSSGAQSFAEFVSEPVTDNDRWTAALERRRRQLDAEGALDSGHAGEDMETRQPVDGEAELDRRRRELELRDAQVFARHLIEDIETRNSRELVDGAAARTRRSSQMGWDAEDNAATVRAMVPTRRVRRHVPWNTSSEEQSELLNEPIRMGPRQRMVWRARERARAALLQPRLQGVEHLRRHLRRQITEPSQTDGLGDRARSLSPENDTAWDTLLTTISPDPQAPSASSSFTSAATSAGASAGASSFGARSSASSTPTSADDEGPSQFFENICETFESRADDSENQDGNSEDIAVLRRAAQPDANVVDEPTLDIFWRGYTEVVTRRADRVARHSGVSAGSSHPFGGMQRIVQGLAGREDIPDEWWASAGLARIVSAEE